MTLTDAPPNAAGTPRLAVRRLFVAVTVALIVGELVLGRNWLASAAAAVGSASWHWEAAAAAFSFASLWSFGAVRQQALRAAGVVVPVRTAVAMSYAAGAIHTTLPGGMVFSAAYAFRQLRHWGASTSVATWCMGVTGVLAAATLTAVGLAGIVLNGGFGGSGVQLVLEIVALCGVFAGIAHVTRRPRALQPAALSVLRLANRLRRRTPLAGADRLTALVSDLATIRPTAGQWFAALGISVANWLFDAACLAACCSAVGLHIAVPAMLLTYTAGMAAVGLSPLPAGLGVVEGTLVVGLTTTGAAAPAALAAVLIYRLISTGGVAAIGWSILGRERFQRLSRPRQTYPTLT